MAEEQVVEKTEETTPKPEEEKSKEIEVKVEEEPKVEKEEVKVEEEPKVEEEEPKPEEEKPKIDIQARISRMYARLQAEREKSTTAEVERDLAIARKEDTEREVEGHEREKALSRDDIEAIWDRKDKEKRFRGSETRVLMRHPDALNEDGSFNMNSEFTRRYIDIGKRNPMLAMMESGPELAEAQVEKELGFSYKKGRVDEAQRTAQTKGAHTGASTTSATTASKVVKLSPVEAKIATRMGMTQVEYATYKEKINKGDKRVHVS